LGTSEKRMNVSYLHRTVKDYLSKKDTRETLKGWISSRAEEIYYPRLGPNLSGFCAFLVDKDNGSPRPPSRSVCRCKASDDFH
jgi:hypothetical protein